MTLTWVPCCSLRLIFLFFWSVHSGPPDPIHGTELYQKVRNTAQVRCRLYWSDRTKEYTWHLFYVQEVARLLFTDTISIKGDITSAGLVPTTMGEQQQEHTHRHQFTLMFRSFKRTLIASWNWKNNSQFLFLLQVWAQELSTGLDCRVLDTVQVSRGKARVAS